MADIRVRSAAVDAVRIVGIAAVVACHVWTEPEWSRKFLFSWNVPIFFFLSGYLWTPQRPLREEVKKRFSTLAIPYLVWFAIVMVLFLAKNVSSGDLSAEDLWRPVLGGNFVGRPFSTMWFVSALFFVAVIYRAMQVLPLRVHWAIATTLLVAAELLPKLFSLMPLGIGTGLVSLVFVVAGVTFRRYRARVRGGIVAPLGAAIVAAVLLSTGWSAPVDLKRADVGTPMISAAVAILVCIALVVSAEMLVPRLGLRAGRWIVLASSAGLFVVFAHPVVLWVMDTRPSGSFSAFAVALAVPWVIGALVRFTALSPLLEGLAPLQSIRARSPR